ncbi:C40 family peptidase [Rhodoferax sp. GW822-FHT02A01]|uniref:C40 family peptidase n=1 Tax=Rhodoferax sp. GW822-FHT02A01 TaxID=3141537 RepID=UPI00315DAA11
MHKTGHPIHRTASRAGCCLAVVLAVGLAGCSTAPTSRTEAPDQAAVDIQSRLSLDAANDVTLYAISLVGTPYRWGGNTPASGFDCSGLIGYVYKTRAGIYAPRTTSALVDWGQPVPPGSLRSGDLVVFAQKGTVNHAGIYVGEGRFVHAPSSGGEVRLDSLSSIYWSRQPVSYRRP